MQLVSNHIKHFRSRSTLLPSTRQNVCLSFSILSLMSSAVEEKCLGLVLLNFSACPFESDIKPFITRGVQVGKIVCRYFCWSNKISRPSIKLLITGYLKTFLTTFLKYVQYIAVPKNNFHQPLTKIFVNRLYIPSFFYKFHQKKPGNTHCNNIHLKMVNKINFKSSFCYLAKKGQDLIEGSRNF